MHTELKWTGPVQQVRPFQGDLNQFALDEPVTAVEQQAGTSHIGEFPAAVLPGFQAVGQL